MKFIQLFPFFYEILQADGSSSASENDSARLGDPGGDGLNRGGVLLRLACGSLRVLGREGRRGGEPESDEADRGGSEKVRGVAFINFDRLLICG